MTSVEKPPEQRCRLCWPDGTCDKVAFTLGFCGLARLVDAVVDDETDPMQGLIITTTKGLS